MKRTVFRHGPFSSISCTDHSLSLPRTLPLPLPLPILLDPVWRRRE